MDLLSPFMGLLGLLGLAMLLFKVFALVDAALVKEHAYLAADKQKKPFWLIILGVAAAWNLLRPSPIDFINLLGLVAAIVYVVDVRPAVRAAQRGGREGTMGPYGPW